MGHVDFAVAKGVMKNALHFNEGPIAAGESKRASNLRDPRRDVLHARLTRRAVVGREVEAVGRRKEEDGHIDEEAHEASVGIWQVTIQGRHEVIRLRSKMRHRVDNDDELLRSELAILLKLLRALIRLKICTGTVTK